MGLNADLNGDGKLSDYENKYYGEPYMAQLGLAPNAIVLLHNLCYASGNSEPGGAAPTVTQSRASGSTTTPRASSRATPGPSSPTATWARPTTSATLFTTGQSVLDAWRAAPNYHGHESSFASTRSPGYVDYSDPDDATSSFYRSLVVKPGLTTTAITKAVGDTGLDPASLVVPGRASVEAADGPALRDLDGNPRRDAAPRPGRGDPPQDGRDRRAGRDGQPCDHPGRGPRRQHRSAASSRPPTSPRATAGLRS